MKLSIVIPVYNEENTFLELLRWVKEEKHDKEIIIVDDFSTDGTRDILKDIEVDPQIKVIYQEKNMGKGAAIREGFKHVSGDIVIIQDADLEYYPDEYAQLVKPIVQGKADVVYGSRFLGSHRAHLYWHYLGNKMINLITNIVLNTCLTDMMTCYKAFKLDVLKSLELKANRFGIEPEMTAEVFRRGYKVYEVPISYNARGYEEGKNITWKDFFRCVFWLFRANLRSNDVGRDTLLKMRVMKNNNQWVFNKFKPFLGAKVLELGSGIGTFSLRIIKHCKELTVSDIDQNHLHLLEERFVGNRRVQVKKIDATHVDQHVEEESYDSIVSLNMMEHVDDDVSMLKGINKVLKTGGNLLLLVPAHQFLYGSLDEEIDHKRRYSRSELKRKLQQSGFELEKFYHMNMFSTLGWVFNFKILKRKKMPLSTIKLVDKFVPLFETIEKIVPVPFGLSIFVVARKK